MGLSDGLQGWWCPSLGGGDAETDLSGNGNNAVSTAQIVSNSEIGGSYAVDCKIDERLVVADFERGGQPWTISLWIKLNPTQPTRYPTWASHVRSSVALGADTLGSEFYASGQLFSSKWLSTAWQSRVYVYGSGSIKLYIDGNLVESSAYNLPAGTAADLILGGEDRAGRGVVALCDQFAVWNRALTSDEVTQLYNGGRSLKLVDLSTGLQGWWCPSLDTSGNGTTTLTDLSGNGNNGTLTNMDAATDWVADTDSGGVRAITLDGIDDFITMGQCNDLEPSSGDFSTMLWCKIITAVGNDGLWNHGSYTQGWNWTFGGSAGGNNTIIVNTTIKQGSPKISGEWVLLGFSKTGTNLTTYVNGVQANAWSDLPATVSPTTADFVIGKDGLNAGRETEVSVDGCAFWNRVITPDEWLQLYNGGRSLNLLGTTTTQSIVPQMLLCRRCRSPIL